MCWRIKEKRRLVIAVIVFLVYGQVWADGWDSGHHDIFNGETYGEIWLYNDSTLDIYGGNIAYLYAHDNTITNWYDGQMGYLFSHDNSIINIYGGILTRDISASGQINLFAYDVLITHTGGRRNNGQVMGKYFVDDASFTFDLGGVDTYTHINIVPEPTTLLLLGLGSIALKRKNR